MKKIVNIIAMVFILVSSLTLNVFAMPYNPNNYTSVNETSQLLPSNIKQSKVTERALRRGDFFSGADLIIMDNGKGNIGALGVGYCNYAVDEAYITIYLDQWDATAERWRQVNFYEQEFYAKDYPDGLITPTVDITFTNNEKGYYYRLRGVFAVIYQGKMEAFSPTTDGILLE